MRTTKGLSTEAIYIFHNMLRKLNTAHKPEYIAAVLESSEPTFRSQEFTAYKANRTEMPLDLSEQLPYIRRLLETLRIPMLQYPGFEADDVIGSIASSGVERGVDVVVVSSDKDMMQLVNEHVSMFNPVKEDVWYDAATVTEFMGVPPERVADLLALKGDSIDNIPGAPGIGEKGARDLIVRFGAVEEALARASEVERKTYRESLQNYRDQILMSKRLATIDTSVPLDWSLDALAVMPPDTQALKQLYRELEFFSILKELGPEMAVHEAKDFATLDTEAALNAWLDRLPPAASMAVAYRDTGELGIGHIGLSDNVGTGRAVPSHLLDSLKPLLADAGRPKIAHDLKSLLLALDVPLEGFFDDVMLYAFLLCADPGGCTPETLVEKHLGRTLGTGAEQYAEAAFELCGLLSEEIDAKGLRPLYRDVELPLVAVLVEMARTGVRIEPGQLRRLSDSLNSEIQRLTAEIHGLAGRTFNIGSPQQLGKVLFDDLNLPAPVRYGRGKTVSTAADVLEDLAQEHEIARKVLEYRQLTKLKGTYVDALPALIEPRTGRLHTTLNQTGAATGRLSSSNPNLQNIPIRTELGREIRAAFVPEPGWKLIAADYSQIELRLLAHMSEDLLLLDAFRRGEDIHTRTAAEVFGVPPLMVTPEMRRNAKAVNFGIVYGQTPFGLATSLGIDRKEADRYIKSYFERYAGVRRFIDSTIAEVRQTGIARTLLGRIRPIPDMSSRNPNARGFAERTAVNTPLQGSAADLIKLAMVRIHRELTTSSLRTRMLLQVHDELLFEVPPEEAADAAKMIKRQMESVYPLRVPLLVEVGIGENWRDAK